MSIAILLGTSRYGGNTHQMVDVLAADLGADVFLLKDYAMTPYDYEHHNRGDDFLPLLRTLMTYDDIIFATPIYWYTMSAQMKIFFDRFSDILDIEKPLGRKLRGQRCWICSTGVEEGAPPQCFEDVFRLSFEYLGMDYRGQLFCECPDAFVLADHQTAIKTFANRVRQAE